MCRLVDLRSLINEPHPVAQHAIDQPSELAAIALVVTGSSNLRETDERFVNFCLTTNPRRFFKPSSTLLSGRLALSFV
jgi:hypothetical protein